MYIYIIYKHAYKYRFYCPNKLKLNSAAGKCAKRMKTSFQEFGTLYLTTTTIPQSPTPLLWGGTVRNGIKTE